MAGIRTVRLVRNHNSDGSSSSSSDNETNCDDFPCCRDHPNGGNRTICHDDRYDCMNRHPRNPQQHPREFCDTCCEHDYLESRNLLIGRIDELPNGPQWNRPDCFVGLLCERCQDTEAKLYLDRCDANIAGQFTTRRNPLVNPVTGPQIAIWPRANNGWRQNLCICQDTVIEDHKYDCHPCRRMHLQDAQSEMNETYDILRWKHENTINGNYLDVLPEEKAVARGYGQRAVDRRQLQRKFHRCPCGFEVVTQPVGSPSYMGVCLACRGVMIEPQNLPVRLQRTRLDRLFRRSGYGTTHGRHHFQIHPGGLK
ncbi:hypothetical protein B0J11DRAFT_534549 [Dendryphion nanum]|uniref:Uncharacterized protein n=1 Tax=Dendryphion nanum TaxID=256645 RepID=A0A9P9DIX4_9PLEO|nr:hypothetical protein B0J11DRAFT_534549 [Dendryphion nanum]